MFNIPLSIQNLQQAIQTTTIFDDSNVIPHLAKILKLLKKDNIQDLDLIELSNVVKQTSVKLNNNSSRQVQKVRAKARDISGEKKNSFEIKNFIKQAQKLEVAGISLGQGFNLQIHQQIIKLCQSKSLIQARFWGKILGSQNDYYVIQGYRPPQKQHINITTGSQKPGEGVNYFTYFVSNNVFTGEWQQLPLITIQHIRTARRIKKIFTGNLSNKIISQPSFPGLQKHYLKAQLARMTHSLELSPKGIYKVNDQNPKVIQYEDQVKIPDFSEISTPEGWVHRNQVILNLGRCTHFIDPSLPEDQIEAVASQLAEKDPQIQRLRSITEDKPAEPVEGGPQSYWNLKIVGNNQTFPKEESQNVYAVSTLKNIFWPGWTTIGYMNGYSNFYLGNGLKVSQPAWGILTNDNLQLEGQQIKQYPEPNPKQLPKVEQAPPAQGQQQNQEE